MSQYTLIYKSAYQFTHIYTCKVNKKTFYKENKMQYKKRKSCRIDAMKLREIGFECSPPL